MFIGYYNLANTVTLLGLASSVMAVFCASQKLYVLAVFMLLFAGICDMFDGRIARLSAEKGKRTSPSVQAERIYGVQLDSLADVISFGVVPAMITYQLGYRGVLDLIVYLIFIICGAIRLAYFNTQALTETSDYRMKYFTGVPIPFSCVMLPVLMLLTAFVEASVSVWVFRLFFLLLGIAYISKVKIKKVGIRFYLGVMAFETICMILLFIFNDFKLPKI